MSYENNDAETAQSKAIRLFNLTLERMLKRVETADEENPLSAAEVAVIATLLKNSNITAATADALRGTKRKPLSIQPPVFSASDDD